jgi:hypothetical protein
MGCVAFAGARSRISVVVEVIAAVILLSCSPTLGIAAVFSRSEDEGERGASVASKMSSLAHGVPWCTGGEKRTDSSSVDLNCCEEIGEEGFYTAFLTLSLDNRAGER